MGKREKGKREKKTCEMGGRRAKQHRSDVSRYVTGAAFSRRQEKWKVVYGLKVNL